MDATESFCPQSLPAFLAVVPDPRGQNVTHPLPAVLTAVCSAILCGAQSYAAIGRWIALHTRLDVSRMHRMGFRRTPPSMYGVRYILQAVDPVALQNALTAWAEQLLDRHLDTLPTPDRTLLAVAIDGKSVRGAGQSSDSMGRLTMAVHLLSAVAHHSGFTLMQQKVGTKPGTDYKTNEHKQALKMLDEMVLQGRLITADAMFCHRDVCRTITEGGGDYLLMVGDNQPTLKADIQSACGPAPEDFSPQTTATLARPSATGPQSR